jgi:hypothetical protein
MNATRLPAELRVDVLMWRPVRESNPRLSPGQGDTLATELTDLYSVHCDQDIQRSFASPAALGSRVLKRHAARQSQFA